MEDYVRDVVIPCGWCDGTGKENEIRSRFEDLPPEAMEEPCSVCRGYGCVYHSSLFNDN